MKKLKVKGKPFAEMFFSLHNNKVMPESTRSEAKYVASFIFSQQILKYLDYFLSKFLINLLGGISLVAHCCVCTTHYQE